MYTKTFFLIYADSDHIFLPTVTFIVMCLFLSVYIPAVALSPPISSSYRYRFFTRLNFFTRLLSSLRRPYPVDLRPVSSITFRPPSCFNLALSFSFIKKPDVSCPFQLIKLIDERTRQARARSELPRIQEC